MTTGKRVRHLRQVLLWPLQLMPIREGSQIQRHWEVLEAERADNPWREVADEFTPAHGQLHERHYNELVTFLPYVQRFLYGEGGSPSPMRVFRRSDLTHVRVTTHSAAPTRLLSIAHVDLYFFFDIDVVILNVELAADDLTLDEAQDILYRFGRAYPAGWDENGQGIHSMARVEWLDAQGTAVTRSDASDRERFLEFAARRHTPRIGADWSAVLAPLVQDQVGEAGPIRYRQIEYYRMPVMAFLAMDDPRELTRNDFVRLAFVTAPGEDRELPYSADYVADFERRYCYDRFWEGSPFFSAERGGLRHNTRYLCCGHGLVVVGDGQWPFFLDNDTGVLGQFRHQYFLIFLIAHFHKAALLMFSDQLVHALERLEVGNPESVKRFKRTIRQRFEIFLRFTHRYWFHEISEQAVAKALFHLCADHLGLDALYLEVKERIHDMDEYLNSDSLRRQANQVVRLTVVTIFGLIGTVSTGFLGMNLIAAADQPLMTKVAYFMVVLVLTIWLTTYTMLKSKRLSDFLDALSDENVSLKEKLAAFIDVGRRRARSR